MSISYKNLWHILLDRNMKKKDLESKPIEEDEIPFEIPEGWEWVRLGEISTYSHTKKKINASKADPHIWGLDLEDIEKGGRLLCVKTVEERKAIGDKTYFNSGDILYSKLRPYLLKILVAPKDGICTPEIIPFTCYGNISGNYIVNVLKSAYVDDYINSVTFGVKMPRVSTETMTSLLIPLPPLAEQRRIVAKIEELMPLVERYGKAQQALDQLNESLPARLRQSILQEAIQGRLVPQDPKEEPASELLKRILTTVNKTSTKKKILTKIKEEDMPENIVDGWEYFYIKDVFFTTSGGTPIKGHPDYYGGDIPWVKSGELNNKYLYDSEQKITELGLKNSSAKFFPIDTVAIAMYGATIGKTSIFKKEMTTNQAICGIFPVEGILPEYIY